jgi:dihydroxyacetone kinase-like predicted kinase
MESLSDICVVAVVSGEGLKKVYESLGVSAVVQGGQTMNPSTQDLVQAIDGLACERVIVLPNNSNIVLTARQAAELANKEVAVVATRTVPQGIAALLAFNYQADLETNCQLMTEAAGQVQTVRITRAVRSVQITACR